MKWKHPPITKIYEALGTVADGRMEVSDLKGKVYSSSRNKFYDVEYELESGSIMSNDNASYWHGYLGYPAIAFLMRIGVLSYSEEMGHILKGVAWKDINQKFKNNFEKALEFVLSTKTEKERKDLASFVKMVDEEIKELDLSMLGAKRKPPQGY